MKRTISKKIEKFEHRYLKDDFKMDKTRSVEIMKEQAKLRDRFSNLENEVNTLNLFISDEWGNESEEELTKLIEKNLTNKLTYLSKINIVINKGYDIIDSIGPSEQDSEPDYFYDEDESSAHENKFNLTSTLTGKENLTSTLITGKETNNFNNLIKLNLLFVSFPVRVLVKFSWVCCDDSMIS